MSTIRAVFLDRDGTINVNRPDYVKSVAEFKFLPGALEALALLAQLSVFIFIVSNQSAVGRGLMTDDALDHITAYMLRDIFNAGGRIDGVYYCRHAPDAGCKCRKPGTGLFYDPLKYYGVDPTQSYMVGDSISDVRAARFLGITPVLIDADGQLYIRLNYATRTRTFWYTSLLHFAKKKFETEYSTSDLHAALALIGNGAL